MDTRYKNMKHRRMKVREEWQPDEIAKIAKGVNQQAQDNWIKVHFWKYFPFVLLILFALFAIFNLGR